MTGMNQRYGALATTRIGLKRIKSMLLTQRIAGASRRHPCLREGDWDEAQGDVAEHDREQEHGGQQGDLPELRLAAQRLVPHHVERVRRLNRHACMHASAAVQRRSTGPSALQGALCKPMHACMHRCKHACMKCDQQGLPLPGRNVAVEDQGAAARTWDMRKQAAMWQAVRNMG